MTRVAAIDCGTNSIRLLVVDSAEAVGAGAGRTDLRPREVLRRTEIVRLGEGVDERGRFTAAALGRVERQAVEYAQLCRALHVSSVRFAATSAARDVEDTTPLAGLVDRVYAPWSTRLEILSGADEARYTFLGATAALRAAGIEGPYLVVDVGGGSTELVRGGADVEVACSLDIGAVRLHERAAPADPPTPGDVARIEGLVDEALDAGLAAVAPDGVGALVGVAGTATTVAAHELDLERYDVDRVHLASSTPSAVATAARRLVAMPVRERRSLGFMTPGRADVIGAGALVWARVVERVGATGVARVVVSEHDLLDGLVVIDGQCLSK